MVEKGPGACGPCKSGTCTCPRSRCGSTHISSTSTNGGNFSSTTAAECAARAASAAKRPPRSRSFCGPRGDSLEDAGTELAEAGARRAICPFNNSASAQRGEAVYGPRLSPRLSLSLCRCQGPLSFGNGVRAARPVTHNEHRQPAARAERTVGPASGDGHLSGCCTRACGSCRWWRWRRWRWRWPSRDDRGDLQSRQVGRGGAGD